MKSKSHSLGKWFKKKIKLSPRRRARLEWLEQRRLLATYVVDNFLDVVDGDYSEGQLSLREAVILSNTNGESDTISLPAGAFNLTLTGAGEDAAATGDLDIVEVGQNLSIVGAGAATTVIHAGGWADHGFHLLPGTSATFDGVKISGADSGILSWSSTLDVTNCTLSSNSSGWGGGGIAAYSSSVVNVSSSTFSENSADWFGGGIYAAYDTSLTVSNSTFSGNSAGYGGGIALSENYPWSASVHVSNSTLTQNSAWAGGGIHAQNSEVQLGNTIVAANDAVFGTDGYVEHEFFFPGATSLGWNLIGNNFLREPQAGDQIGTPDPMLGPLQDNGGPTWTHAPLEGSPVIDTGMDNPGNDPTGVDQRGYVRPVYIGVVEPPPGDGSDIGAVEIVLSAQDQAANIIEKVDELLASGVLDSGEANSLTKKLDSAIDQLEAEKTEPAFGKLGAFINQVEALVKSERLTPEEGQALIDAANAAIDLAEAEAAGGSLPLGGSVAYAVGPTMAAAEPADALVFGARDANDRALPAVLSEDDPWEQWLLPVDNQAEPAADLGVLAGEGDDARDGLFALLGELEEARPALAA